MANTIRIARSVSTNTPSSLAQGELANSETGSPNGINELFIGEAGPGVFKLITNTGGAAAEPNSSTQDNQSLTTGTGIDGADGGSTTGFTMSLALDELSVTSIAAADWIAFDDAGTSSKALVSGIDLALFSNSAGWTSNAGIVTSIGDGTGTIVTGTGAVPIVSVDYAGTDNFIDSATNLESTAIATGDTIVYHDATDDNVKKGFVSDLPFGAGTGDITRVDITAGIGLTGDLNTTTGDHIQTIDMDFTTLTDMTGNIAGTTEFIVNDAGTESRKAASEIQLSFFNNNSGWEANDAATVLTTDTGSATWNWIIDEDLMGSDSDAHVPTQQSVKAYVDTAVTGALTHKGGYNASTNTPALDTGSPTLAVGDMYTVTVAGTFFTVPLEVGDVLISDVDSTDAAALADWTIVQSDLQYASETVPGFIELANQTEVDGGSDSTRAIVSSYLHNTTFDGGTF